MEDKLIDAFPSKEFFIEMITKDINLDKAILELIDNSIDGLRRSKMKINNGKISITIDDDLFSIEDNCGGIPLGLAKGYAFKFGRPKDIDPIYNVESTIGRFGIGMKRTLFKIGKIINIKTKSSTDSFDVNILVNDWIKDQKDWNFEYIDGTKDSIGTIIEITDLYIDISRQLNEQFFINSLRDRIESTFNEFIKQGLEIIIKHGQEIIYTNTNISERENELVDSNELPPIVKQYEYKNVKVKLIAAFSKKVEDGKYDLKKAGWNIYCNDRLIIEKDKSELTGWGVDGHPQFHPELNRRFRGFCYLESDNPNDLPWNTTKTQLEANHPVYVTLLPKLCELIEEFNVIQRKINQLDIQDANDIETINKIENDSRRVENVKHIEYRALPSTSIINKLPSKVTISYTKSKKEIDILKGHLNVTSAKDVGLKTYEYYVAMEGIKIE
jgi:hypothetical protein